jgi:nicotinate-nucleotide pyrophosphorylase (carboxylating)
MDILSDGAVQSWGEGLPPWVCLDGMLRSWIAEDIGRGDVTTQALLGNSARPGEAVWIAKADGVIAGLPIAERLYHLIDPTVQIVCEVCDGEFCPAGTPIARFHGSLASLLMGERVALNTVMHLSGIATETRAYVDLLADLPVSLVDTRKTTPGLRVVEKYASRVAGAVNHRMGLDDAVMLKDNHIQAAGGIEPAMMRVQRRIPYPLTIEIETETLDQVETALLAGADIIMLDNMPIALMEQAVAIVRQNVRPVQLEASGNITLETIRAVALTGVDYISTSAPITRSPWLDISMRFC